MRSYAACFLLALGLYTVRRGDALSTRHAFVLAFAPFRVLKFRVLKYCRISPFVIYID